MSTRPFYTGASGTGNGPHAHAGLFDPERGDYIDPTPFVSALTVNGKPLPEQFKLTSGFGPRNTGIPGASTHHRGLDYATPPGTPVLVSGGRWKRTYDDPGGGGRVAVYDWEGPDKRRYEWRLLHGDEKLNTIGELAAGAQTQARGAGVLPSSGDPSDFNNALRQFYAALFPGGSPGGGTPSPEPFRNPFAPQQPAPVAQKQPEVPAPVVSAPVAPQAQAPADWRAAASAADRVLDAGQAAYYQRGDIQQWAKANPTLARRLMAERGLDPS